MMKSREKKLAEMYAKAILPDKQLQEKNPETFSFFKDILSEIGKKELQNYCDGLEARLEIMQQRINDLQKKLGDSEQQRIRLEGECKGLEWQLDYSRKYLTEIKDSRSWFLARQLHFLRGFCSLDRNVIAEFKNELNDLVVRQRNSEKNNNLLTAFYMVMKYLVNGSSDVAKKLLPQATPYAEELPQSFELPYCSEYQEDEFFDPAEGDIRAVAFYLPQFHAIPENDEWWGKDFTEWTNTRKAKPRFPGHYQPRSPHADIGYYDLSEIETLRRQAKLAKAHDIHTFCMYYYWFDGKKLLETPVDLLLKHKDIDISFCLCWANENWTRTWDGQEKSVLIKQNYSPENDIEFIKDLKKYLVDPRYMRCGGKPVILVYHAKILPDQTRTFSAWRRWCRKNGIGEIQIWTCRTFIKTNEFNKNPEVDREVEFPPHMVASLELFPSEKFQAYDGNGFFYNYSRVIKDVVMRNALADRSPYPIYRCATMGWDNSCRRERGWSVWQYFSLKSYHAWMKTNIEYTRKHFLPDERFVFINAWNEWAEGTYLEPDGKYGYANINTTTRALRNLPYKPEYEVLSPYYGTLKPGKKVLVHYHCFYPELAEEMAAYLNHIPFEYDCIITTDCHRKREKILETLERTPLGKVKKIQVKITANRGRDIAPFFLSCSSILKKYDYVGHFHTKRSYSVNWGDEWRYYLLNQLLGSTASIAAIFNRFERDENLGLYFPAVYPAMRDYLNWENNLERCKALLKKMGMQFQLPPYPHFPVGQMFWAKTDALRPLFEPGVVEFNEFEEEVNQLTDTLAHAFERLWTYVAQGANYSTLSAVVLPPPSKKPVKAPVAKRLAVYVHYQNDGKVSEADIYCLEKLAEVAEIFFVSNGHLQAEDKKKVAKIARRVVNRENTGFDFGAWRDMLANIDHNAHDEIILLNNSVIGPFVPFSNIFAKMETCSADFWGMSEFPQLQNSPREEAKELQNHTIPRHLQSYFMVFRKPVLQSALFWDFWHNVEDEGNIIRVVARYETQLSGVLERAGFRYDVYLRTAAALQEINKHDPDYNALYCRPLDFIILGFPFLKKNICYYLPQAEVNEVVHSLKKLTDYPIEKIQITAKRR